MVRFRDAHGAVQVGEVNGRFPAGTEVPVIYLPEDPTVVRHRTEVSLWALVFMVLFGIAVMCWILPGTT